MVEPQEHVDIIAGCVQLTGDHRDVVVQPAHPVVGLGREYVLDFVGVLTRNHVALHKLGDGVLTGVYHVFRVYPEQHQQAVAMHALLPCLSEGLQSLSRYLKHAIQLPFYWSKLRGTSL